MKRSINFLTICITGFAIQCDPINAQDKPSQSVGVARLSAPVVTAINKGLASLAKKGVQNADGSWGGNQNRVAETALSLMAFMLPGNVPGRGLYGRHMNLAIEYLLNIGKSQR